MRRFGIAFAALLLPGTAPAVLAAPGALPAPAHAPPALPDAFRHAPAPTSESASGDAALADGWWRNFGDPVLDRMVETALADNFDIAAAAARLEQAAAGVKAANGARLPAINLGGSAAVQQLSTEDVQGRAFSRFPGFQRTVEQYGLSGAASWELDLFGRLSAGARATRAEAGAAEAGLAGARLTIAAEVASTYIAARGLEARLAVARARVAVLDETDRLLRLRAASGIAALTETDRSGAELAGAASAIPVLEAALEAARNRLDVLMGRAPGNAAQDMAGSGGIPAVRAPAVPDGPASLLVRRPDVAAAERLLAASDARVAAAIAARYPRLTIAALAGFLANGLSNLLTGGAVQAGASAGISAPLFAGGRLSAQQDGAEAARREAVAGWRQTVLRAAEESEDALSALSQRGKQAAALDTVLARLGESRARIESAVRAGAASRVDALAVERQRLGAQDDALAARAEAARAGVLAFRALGGGWQTGAGQLAVSR